MAEKRVLVWTNGGEEVFRTLCGAPGVEVLTARNREEAIAAMTDADALVTSTIPWGQDFAHQLAKYPRLRWIQFLNAGFDNVEALGVPGHVAVSTIGEIGSAVVAEHAMALLLALLRQVPGALWAQRRAEWTLSSAAASVSTLRGREVAVIGFGHIGRAVAALARALGARVTAVARTARVHSDGTLVRPFEALLSVLAQMSIVVICAPLNRTSRKMFDAQAFSVMPRSSWLVNVARGGIVDTDALVNALESGVLAGAALDVTDPEPLPAGHPLWTHPRVIITPHVAAMGQAAVREAELRELVIENVRRFVAGEPLLNLAPIGAMAQREPHAHR